MSVSGRSDYFSSSPSGGFSLSIHSACSASTIQPAATSWNARFIDVSLACAARSALRAHLAEFGIVAAQGLRNVGELIAIVRDDGDTRLPDVVRQVLEVLANQIEQIETAVAGLERQLLAWHKTNPVSQRLASIPGIGPIIATAIATTVADPKVFRSGREFAAWLGLVPRQNSTGGKTRLGGITKRGNRYLRRLLINGASANL